MHDIMANGACGAFWWGAHNGRPPVPGIWEAINQLRREMDTLDPGVNIKCDNRKISFTLRQYQGDFYLIAVNTSAQEQDASFSLDEKVFRESGRASVMFDGGEKRYSRGVLADKFAPLARRVYKIGI